MQCTSSYSRDDLETDFDEFYFQWHLTEKCNRTCSHCYQISELTPELPLSELLRIANLMEKALEKWGKHGTLSLTGGEPFIRHDDLHMLMTKIDQSRFFVYYDILTNGSLISDEEGLELSKFKKLRRVQVSLEGATAKSNDAIRGEGSFNSTIEAIRRLRNNSIDVAVMTTISRVNKNELATLIQLLETEEVQTLALERFIPEGRGKGMSDQVLSQDELRDVYESVYKLAAEHSRLKILMHRPLFAMISPGDPSTGAICSVGNNALTIMPDGTVYPCRRLPIAIGNVLEDGFFKIWYNSEVLWQIRDPDNYGGKCHDCELFSQCRGCRAAAYFATGDYMAEDPQCWH